MRWHTMFIVMIYVFSINMINESLLVFHGAKEWSHTLSVACTQVYLVAKACSLWAVELRCMLFLHVNGSVHTLYISRSMHFSVTCIVSKNAPFYCLVYIFFVVVFVWLLTTVVCIIVIVIWENTASLSLPWKAFLTSNSLVGSYWSNFHKFLNIFGQRKRTIPMIS